MYIFIYDIINFRGGLAGGGKSQAPPAAFCETLKMIRYIVIFTAWLDIIGASKASPFLVMNVAILSVCVCHGPARYLFFVLVTLYQLYVKAAHAWAPELAS